MDSIKPEDAPTCEKCGGQIEHTDKLFTSVPENGLCECLDVPNWNEEDHIKLRVQVKLAIEELLKTIHRFELPSEIAEHFDVELITAIVHFSPGNDNDLIYTRERILRAAGVAKSAWGRWLH